MTESVLFSVEDRVAVITLNRPERRNAINQSLLIGFYDCLDTIAGDDSIRAAVLTGNGKSFCSGLDLDVLFTEKSLIPAE